MWGWRSSPAPWPQGLSTRTTWECRPCRLCLSRQSLFPTRPAPYAARWTALETPRVDPEGLRLVGRWIIRRMEYVLLGRDEAAASWARLWCPWTTLVTAAKP